MVAGTGPVNKCSVCNGTHLSQFIGKHDWGTV